MDRLQSNIGSEFYAAVAKYAAKYRDETIVLKFGGELVAQPEVVNSIMEQAITLVNFGCKVVLVHGGGPQIDTKLREAGIVPKKRDGVRDTDAQTLETTDRCLAALNRELGISCHTQAMKMGADNVSALPMAGYDGGIIMAQPKFEGSQTGSITTVKAERFDLLMDNQIIPIIYPVCKGENGLRMNVNADEVAASLAITLGARRLIICSNTPGVLDKDGQRIAQINISEVEGLIDNGVVTGGMIPKIKACKEVAERLSIGGVVILKGDEPGAIEKELFSDEGAGTLIRSTAKLPKRELRIA